MNHSTRVHPNKYGFLRLQMGTYGQDMGGHWWVRPEGHDAYKLDAEDVIEHEDGTITVTTRINGHGLMLERGIWRKS